MSQRLSDYLTRETTEYLDQLDRLLSLPGRPDPEHLLRLARGVRGSAQMAGLETIAAVAERLEDALQSVISNTIIWSEEIRLLGVQTVRDLQILVRALSRWGPEEEARVRSAIHRWDEIGSGEAGGVVPISALYFDDSGPHVVAEATTRGADEVVSIDDLLLRGEPALREALRLRPEVEALLGHGSQADLKARIAELFDLMELALPTGSRPAA